MELHVQRYVRKPLYADVVQVTEENMQAVAQWCGGEVKTTGQRKNYVKVKVERPLNPRQTMAFVGDYVLLSIVGEKPSFKVYIAKAFNASFEPVKTVEEHGDEAVDMVNNEHGVVDLKTAQAEYAQNHGED